MSHIENLQQNLSKAQEIAKQMELEERQKSAPAKRLLELLKPCVIKYDIKKHPGSLFWFDGDNLIMHNDLENDRLWVHYDKLWLPVANYFYHFDLSDRAVCNFIKETVEHHFNLKVGRPYGSSIGWDERF